jgi:hypothetical protein
VSDLSEEVRRAARAVPNLGDRTGTLWPKVSAALRATCDDVERRLASDATWVLIVGGRDARRAFLDAVLGEDAFARADGESPELLLTIRHGARARWSAKRADGTAIETENDRSRELDASVARAETDAALARERAAAKKKLEALRAALPPRSAQPTRPAVNATLARRAAFGWRRFVAWLVALVAAIAGRRERSAAKDEPAPSSARVLEEMVPLERALLDAEAFAAQAESDLERLRGEREAYLEERRARFVEEVRALVSADGGAVEVDVEHPTKLLEGGIVLVDAPVLTSGTRDSRERAWKRVRHDLGGSIAVDGTPAAIDEAPIELLGPLAPVPAPAEPTPERIAATFDRVRREAKVVAAVLAVADVERRINSLAEASAKAEREVRERIATMERERVPSPARFREEQMARMRPVVDEAARRILRSVQGAFRAALSEIESEWAASIDACADRSSVQSCVARINETAQSRVQAVVEELGQALGREVQASSETLQAWVLDEMSVRYRTLSAQIEASAVILSDVPEDVPAIHSVPLPPFMLDAFEERRVGIGLGGAAAGAAIGTLILPGIGTALGAFVGVFAGFLEGLAPLKKESLGRVRAYLEQVERDVAARLSGGPDGQLGLAADLRISLEETLDAALERREEAIAKLIEMEQVALVRENGKLEDLTRLRAALDAHGRTFAALAATTSAALRDLVASRRSPSRLAAQEGAPSSIGA